MAFPVAVQSAIFYVLSCTPCLSARNRYRTRQKSRREREERARQDEEEPELYRHPSPFNVNPYWQEEIMMGPSLPKKGRSGGNKSPSQRKLTSAGKESSSATRSSLAISHNGTPPDGGPGPSTAGGASSTGPALAGNGSTTAPPPASPTLVPDDTHSISTADAAGGEGWNNKRYQREDEELWGSDLSRTSKLMDVIVKAGSSAGRLLESRLGKDRSITDADRAKFYTPTIIHPPVNEYHPPVVSSKPAHKDALRWMLQPPPPAKVMEGKVPVSRSTSVASSGGATVVGRRSTGAGSDVSLTRRMAMEARLRRAESNTSTTGSHLGVAAMLSAEEAGDLSVSRRASSGRAGGGGMRPKSQHHTMQGRNRSRSGSASLSSSVEAGWSSDEDDSGLKMRWRFPLSAAVTPAEEAEPSVPQPAMLMVPHSPTHTVMRPKLSTIVSSDAGSTVSADLSDNKAHSEMKTTASETKTPEALTTTDVKDHPWSACSSLDSGLALAA